MPSDGEPRTRSQKMLSMLAWARLGLLIVLPAFLATAGAVAASQRGQARTNWIMVIVFVTLVVGFLNTWKEFQARKAARSAVSAKATLAGSLSQAGKPLVTLLTKVAEAKASERRAEVKTLISRTVQLCWSQCGRMTHHKCKTRAVLYLFKSPDILIRQEHDGREGKAPRPEFNALWGDANKYVVEMAHSENYLLVRDTEGDETPAQYVPQKGCEYKSFLQVPVRTAQRSFGFLSVDSDKPYSLTEADVGYVVLMARLLAAALALLGEDYPQLVPTEGKTVPRQGKNAASTEVQQ